MEAKEYFEKCTPDSLRPIKVYLLFMKRLCDENYSVPKSMLPTIVDTPVEDVMTNRWLYFLNVLYELGTDVGEMIRLETDFVNKVHFPDSVVSVLTKARDDVFSGDYGDEIEMAFVLDDEHDGPIKCFTKVDSKIISIERIVYGLSVAAVAASIVGDFEDLGLDKICREALSLAEVKEAHCGKDNSFPQLPARTTLEDLSKILAGSDDLKVQVFGAGEGGKPEWRDATQEFRERMATGISQKKDEKLSYGKELTSLDYEENPLVGRLAELRILKALLLDPVKSAIVYGNPGVGKTTLINGLAYEIKNKIAYPELNDKRIYELSAGELIAGTEYRGTFEKRVLKIAENFAKQGNVIWFIDEIHTIMGLGQPDDGALDASNILKPFLSEGKFKIIGGTTPLEYRILEIDSAFERRFNGFELREPKEKEVVELLRGYISKYERLYGMGVDIPKELTDTMLKLLIELSKEELQNPAKRLANPDFSLTILNLAYDFARVDGKKAVDIDALKEGVEFSDRVSSNGKKYFMQMSYKFKKH